MRIFLQEEEEEGDEGGEGRRRDRCRHRSSLGRIAIAGTQNFSNLVARTSPIAEVRTAQDAEQFSNFLLSTARRSELASRVLGRRVEVDVVFDHEAVSWDVKPKSRTEQSVQLDVEGCVDSGGALRRGPFALFLVQAPGSRPALVAQGSDKVILRGRFDVS